MAVHLAKLGRQQLLQFLGGHPFAVTGQSDQTNNGRGRNRIDPPTTPDRAEGHRTTPWPRPVEKDLHSLS